MHRPCQDHFPEVAAFADEIVDSIAVADAHHALIDDRPLVITWQEDELTLTGLYEGCGTSGVACDCPPPVGEV